MERSEIGESKSPHARRRHILGRCTVTPAIREYRERVMDPGLSQGWTSAQQGAPFAGPTDMDPPGRRFRGNRHFTVREVVRAFPLFTPANNQYHRRVITVAAVTD